MRDYDEMLTGCLVVLAVVVVVTLLTALPVMWLWNWLMPDLFALQTITFWQALGLSFLTALLFKSNVPSQNSKK